MKNTKFTIVGMIVIGLLFVAATLVQINKPQDNRSSAKDVETVEVRPQTTSTPLRCGEGMILRSGRCLQIDSEEVMLQQLTVDDSTVDSEIQTLESELNN